jgi:hypothetical protein
MTQLPPLQVADVTFCSAVQSVVQVPQCLASVCKLVSQPLAAFSSQSAKFSSQMKPQSNGSPEHVALALSGSEQTAQVVPQAAGVLLVTHPSPVASRQNPLLQVKPQMPLLHVAAALAGAVQTVQAAPHASGLLALEMHELPIRQNPVLQVKSQTPLLQVGAPLSGALQTAQLAPQALGLLALETHVPPLGQNPVLQVKPQPPPTQVAAPLLGTGHTLPQVPQLAMSVWRLTHAPHCAGDVGQIDVPQQAVVPLGQAH